jgi:hypothetical protein
MSRRAEPNALPDGFEQLGLFERPATKRRARRSRYRHVRTAEELAAFEWTKAVVYAIRPDWLDPDRRLCPGGCGKVIHQRRRSCGRRWCDAVRPTWGRTVGEVIRAALSAYVELYAGNGRVLTTALTCRHEPGWWDTGRCGHPADGSRCSGPGGCRVRPEIEERERRLFPERRRAALKMARAEAVRKLQRAGYPVDRETLRTLTVLISVTEDQQRGLPHEHIVCGHTTALEIAFTRAFFDALSRAARRHGLGFTDRYRYALAKQGHYRADRFHGYLAKLARYLAKNSGGEFLQKHQGQRVFYVAPWLTRLSGYTMTVARLCRCVWAARHGYCEMPRIPDRLLATVERLMGPLAVAPNAP